MEKHRISPFGLIGIMSIYQSIGRRVLTSPATRVKNYRPLDSPCNDENNRNCRCHPRRCGANDAIRRLQWLELQRRGSGCRNQKRQCALSFSNKGLLGAAVARRYTDRLAEYLEGVDARGGEPNDALAAYVAVFRTTLEQDGRMCLCGMLAVETDAIPQEVRAEIRRFVEINVLWISISLERVTGVSATSCAAREHARALFAALKGAMLVARGTADAASFDAIAAQYRRVDLIPVTRDI